MPKQKYFVKLGERFNRLLVVGETKNNQNRTAYQCLCDCGNTVVTTASALVHGLAKSCSCLTRERTVSRNTRHGDGRREQRTRLYRIWKGMRGRCFHPDNPQYRDYGGRGITVCAEWDGSYVAFREWALANGYTDELSIDRIDNNAGYEPANCRWATQEVQANNTRRNKRYFYKGENLTISQLSKKYMIPLSSLNRRLDNGWDISTAIETAVKKRAVPIMITFNGQTKQLSEWCRELSLNYYTVWSRLERGWSADAALSTSGVA